jgi:hypothetical protein
MAHTEALQKYLLKLLESIEIDDAAFADAIYRAMSEGGIAEESFREAFGLAEGAVERWTQRQSLPQVFVRRNIIEWLLENLQPASK